MRYVAVASGLLAACAGPPRAAPSVAPSSPPAVTAEPAAEPPDELAEDPVASVTFAPSGEPAARYNDPPPAIARTVLGDAVAAAVREEAARVGLVAPRLDGRLSRACTDLAELVPEPGREQAPFDAAAIEFALQRNGIIESEVRLLFGAGDVTSTGGFAAELRPKLAGLLHDGPFTRFGVGIVRRRPGGTAAVVFALQGSSISTTPIPRAIPAHGELVVDAVIDARFREPEVIVTRDDGSTRELAVDDRPGGFAVRLSCSGQTGRQQIEMAASDSTGVTVLANFPVWCGTEPPRQIAFQPVADDPPVEQPEDAERHLLARVNRDRAAAHLPPLLWSAAAAAVARGHSEEMRTTHVVSHVSPTTGTAVDRVRAAHIPTRIVLENIARGFGLREAHHALMNSPGHRANVLSIDVTHVGIGIVLGAPVSGRREIYITEIFLREPFGTDPCASGAIAGCRRLPVAPL
ncbi:MAG TPA: CAP domain-containing protein [Kofleriaceae bacterium]|jgi:uncharacterized protein YkwD|nr:CAP domain-containing protein [Kofleriaceae bacterium]